MSSMQIIIVVVVVVVLLGAVGAVLLSRRRALRARFGPEYDRAVSEQHGRDGVPVRGFADGRMGPAKAVTGPAVSALAVHSGRVGKRVLVR